MVLDRAFGHMVIEDMLSEGVGVRSASRLEVGTLGAHAVSSNEVVQSGIQ